MEAARPTQIEHLGHQGIGHSVIDFGAEEKNALHPQAGVDIDPALVLAAG
jgi:hypothetical protein